MVSIKEKRAQKKAHTAKLQASHKNDTPKQPKAKFTKKQKDAIAQRVTQTPEQKLEYWKKRSNDILSRSWKFCSEAQAESLKWLRHAGADTVKVDIALAGLGKTMATLVKEINEVSLLKTEAPKALKGGSHAEVKKNESR